MYALLVPNTDLMACRGDPLVFNPENLVVDKDKLDAFLKFLDKYEIPHEEPNWLLFSYWG